MRRPGSAPAAVLAVAALGCAAGDSLPAPAPLPAPVAIPSPAGPGSAEPNLSTAADGTVLLSWIEPDGEGHALRYAVLDDAGWTAARTIVRGTDWFVNWADFPSIVQLADSTLAAHWLERLGEGTYAYGVRIARSHDGGATWSEPVTPHRDASPAEHGFVTLYDAGDGALGAVWLDGRRYASGDEVMTLRHTTIAPDGTLGAEQELDARVCDCCQTTVAQSDERVLVFYRDRSEEEIRDIGVVALEDSAWTAPRIVHADAWRIDACPVNGPQSDARGSHVALAWFTAAGDEPRVNVVFSSDGGRTFGPPVRIDDGAPGGRVDLLMLEDGSAVVSWLERVDGSAEIRLRRVAPEGAMSEPTIVTRTGAERASGFPRMTLSGSSILLAWTGAGAQPGATRSTATAAAPAQVLTARVHLPDAE